MLPPSIVHLCEYQAKQHPASTAIKFFDQSLDYQSLNACANQWASYLLSEGLREGDVVAVCMEKRIETVVLFLACLKARLVFLPINTDLPFSIIQHVLTESNAHIVCTQSTLIMRFAQTSLKILDVMKAPTYLCHHSTDNLSLSDNSNSLAYIMYTSGTTGMPKGVMVTHSNLAGIFQAWAEVYFLAPGDRHLQMANYFFDVFIGDTVRALCSGGTLILCPKKFLLKPHELYALCIQEKINCAEFVPVVLKGLVDYIQQKKSLFPSLKTLICGSDHWHWQDALALKALCSKATRIFNSYGMTEATIDSTYFEIPSHQDDTHLTAIPIGKPFANTEVFIVDESLTPVSAGMPGEIYISGSGLTSGYLNNPILTKQKFQQLTLQGINKTAYRTGDVGYYDETGNIHLVGRIDTQVKLNGQRINLATIENQLNQHPGIKGCLVKLQQERSDLTGYLVAYLVLDHHTPITTPELMEFLQTSLPWGVIPQRFLRIPALPLTTNGKVDRNILLQGFPIPANKHKIKVQRLADYFTADIQLQG